MSLTEKLNPALESLPVYQPGRPIEEVAREYGLSPEAVIKLASNENPLGPSPCAFNAAQAELHRMHQYPDGNCYYLKQRLSEELGLSPSSLIIGNGSNEIIEFAGHAFMQPEVDVVVSEYCFPIYPIVAKLFGANVITVPAKELGHDLNAMRQAITPKTRVIFVANPNNPTGTIAPKEEVIRLVESVPSDILVVIDEAYIEYLEDPLDLLPYVRDRKQPNLLLMRTFSKIYGLAGLRVGYGMAQPELVSAFQKIREPFNVNRIGQAAALAALDDREHVRKTRENNTLGRQYLEEELSKLGLEYARSAANFIAVRVGDSQRIFDNLQREGVIVRPMIGARLPEWIRVGIGSQKQNARLIEALKANL